MNHRLDGNRSRHANGSPRDGATRSQTRDQREPDVKSLDAPRLDRVPLKFIRFKAVRERTGLSRSTIWRLERVSAFPKHHKISPNAVAWVEQDVVDWIRSKAGGR